MELVDVASFFDRVSALDPVPAAAPPLQLPTARVRRASATHLRPTAGSCHQPQCTLPADRVIELHGVDWLVGEGQTDGWEVRTGEVCTAPGGGRANVYRLASWLAEPDAQPMETCSG